MLRILKAVLPEGVIIDNLAANLIGSLFMSGKCRLDIDLDLRDAAPLKPGNIFLGFISFKIEDYQDK